MPPSDRELPELHRAALEGDHARVESLLASGADPNEPCDHPNGEPDFLGMTPLMMAACSASPGTATLDVLLANGADPGAMTSRRQSALLYAARIVDANKVAALLHSIGSHPGLAWIATQALTRALESSKSREDPASTDCTRVLLDAIGDLTRPECARRALGVAVREGSVECLEILLDAGAQFDPGSRDALQLLAEAGSADVARWLIARGVDPTAEHRLDIPSPLEGRAPRPSLTRPAAFANVERRFGGDAIIAFLEAGIGVDVRGRHGATLLHAAAGAGNEPAVKALVAAGADPRAVDDGGQTPLHRAMRRRSLAVVDLLLDAGAEIDRRDAEGRTALHHASKNHREAAEIVSGLLERGADLEARDRRDRTPFLLAAERCSLAGLKALVAAGADIHNRALGLDALSLVEETAPSRWVAEKLDNLRERSWPSLAGPDRWNRIVVECERRRKSGVDSIEQAAGEIAKDHLPEDLPKMNRAMLGHEIERRLRGDPPPGVSLVAARSRTPGRPRVPRVHPRKLRRTRGRGLRCLIGRCTERDRRLPLRKSQPSKTTDPPSTASREMIRYEERQLSPPVRDCVGRPTLLAVPVLGGVRQR